jgi:16S rRNA (guanine(966)-N(2))-methyltransferase RsmD
LGFFFKNSKASYWLQFETQGKTFLDLFSGSGALSFEALSRGAKQVVSVEKDTNALHFLEQNKQLLKADNLTIFRQDAFEFLKKKPKKPFDLILLDPPLKAPLPENKSKKVFPCVSNCNQLNKVSRTLLGVGLNPSASAKINFLLRCSPPII